MFTSKLRPLGCLWLVCALAFATNSEARFPRGGGASSSFNGGKSQVNLNFYSYPFINVIKAAGDDLKEASGSPLFGAPSNPANRDADGWPKSTTNGWIIQVDIPSSADRPGNWIQTWTTTTGGNTAQNLTTAVAYTITAANNNANATVTINTASPVSPNIRTANQLKVGQCIQIAGTLSGGTWNSISGNVYKVLDPAVGADPTKVQIDLNSTGLGTFSSGGQVKNSLVDTTTAAAVCSGRYVFTPPSNGTLPISQQPGFSALGSSTTGYARDVALYYDDDEAVFLAGQIWSPNLIAKLRDGKYGILRTLDLQANNIEKTVDWATRKPVTYASYHSTRWIPESISPSGMTTTSSTGAAYALAWAGYSLANNAIVHVYFNRSQYKAATAAVSSGANTIITVSADSSTNAVFAPGDSVSVGLVEGSWSVMNGNYTVQSASSTSVTINYDSSGLTPGGFAGGRPVVTHRTASLNVGGTGAINILGNNTSALSPGGDTIIQGGTTNSYATLIYKSNLNAFIKTGGDIRSSSGYATYIPPELIVSLCTAVGAYPYVLTPSFDDNADWTTNFATYVRDNGPSWMRYIQETTNETFNSFSGFDNNGYAVAQQLYQNGGWNQSTGLPSGTTYSATSVTTGATTSITFNVAFTGQVGALLQLGGTWSGSSGLSNGQLVHVTAINVSGNPNRVTIDAASSGTWTSGGTAVANPGERYEWVGTQLAKFAKAVSDVYSGNTARYDTLLGVQLAAAQSAPSLASTGATLNSPQFVLQGGWPAYTYTTAGDTSNYIKSSEYGTGTETTRVAAWAPRQGTGTINGTTLTMSGGTNPNVGDELAGYGMRIGTTVLSGSAGTYTVDLAHTPSYTGNIFAGVAATRRSEETAYLNASVTGTDQENLNVAVTYWLNLATYLNGFGIKKLYAYEGGPDQFSTGQTSATDQFRFYTLQSATWETLIQTVYASWGFGQYPPVSSQYPSGFTAVFPSQFYFAGPKPRSQAWTMLADIYEPDTGLFLGIKAFNQ